MANRSRSGVNIMKIMKCGEDNEESYSHSLQTISYKSTVTNLKRHLKRKYISVHFDLSARRQHGDAQINASTHQEVVTFTHTSSLTMCFYTVQRPPKRQKP